MNKTAVTGMSDSEAMSNPYWWPSDPPPERAILSDLIAELRATHKQGNWCETDCCSSCTHCECCGGWPCGEIEAADRAEARLREVGDDE